MASSFADQPILTVQQHILQEQRRWPGASGEFSWLLSGITLAAKMIQAKVRRAGLIDILGAEGAVNVQGEIQQKLDVYANQALLYCLGVRESVGVLASEENETPVVLRKNAGAKYVVVFDPLDGSSNIDVGVSVGTTFSILRRPEDRMDQPAHEDEVLQPGTRQVAAGYVVYGSSTILVYSVGNGVHGFTLDPNVGAFVLSHENIRMPNQGKYYSVNEAYRDDFPKVYQRYIDGLRSGELGVKYASRYIGSMVADFHRTLLKGGVFLYPPTADHREGKLRLLYEVSPMAFLAEQAGGMALADDQRVLDIVPRSLHQRSPLVTGSMREMEFFQECLRTSNERP